MYQDAVNPSMDAAGKASLLCTPRHMISRAQVAHNTSAIIRELVARYPEFKAGAVTTQ